MIHNWCGRDVDASTSARGHRAPNLTPRRADSGRSLQKVTKPRVDGLTRRARAIEVDMWTPASTYVHIADHLPTRSTQETR